MKRAVSIVGLLIAVFAAVGFVALAEEQQRVAILVHVSAPPDLESREIGDAVLRLITRDLGNVEGIVLIASDEVVEAARRMGIGPEPTAREIRALARVLRADRVVLLQVTMRDHFAVIIHAAGFSAQGRLIFEFRLSAFAPQLNTALERAVRFLLDKLVPALLRR
jgi:hypothetical protein